MFVYRVSNVTENIKRASKYIFAKFIYISRNLSAYGSDNNMRWLGLISPNEKSMPTYDLGH